MIPVYALFFFFIDFFLLLFFPFLGPYLGWRVEIPAYFVPFPALFLALYPRPVFRMDRRKESRTSGTASRSAAPDSTSALGRPGSAGTPSQTTPL